MSNRPDERLTRLLHERAEGQSPAPISFDDVTGRARVIRRRRRTAAAALAAAVVAAIAVPTALLLGGQPDAAPPPSHQATPRPTPSSTPTSSGLALTNVRQGPAPAIPYVTGHTVHLDGGHTASLPAGFHGITGIAAYHGGWLVTDSGRGGQTNNQGRIVRRGIGGLVTSSDGTQIAFGAPNGKVLVGTQMSQGEQSYDVANPGSIVGFLSGGRLLYDDGAGQGSVHLLGSGARPLLSALVGASDANESKDLVAGSLSDRVAGVVSAPTGKPLWRTSGRQLQRFSPDGRYVSAMTRAGDGSADVSILDAQTGRELTSFRLTSHGLRLLLEPVWETDSSLLFGVARISDGSEAVLRLSASGRLDRATPVRDAPRDRSAYAFAARP